MPGRVHLLGEVRYSEAVGVEREQGEVLREAEDCFGEEGKVRGCLVLEHGGVCFDRVAEGIFLGAACAALFWWNDWTGLGFGLRVIPLYLHSVGAEMIML